MPSKQIVEFIDKSFQVIGAAWYLIAVERYDACWRHQCEISKHCRVDFLYCGSENMRGYSEWDKVKEEVLKESCQGGEDDNKEGGFDFGIFKTAVSSNVISSTAFGEKFLYCLWFGLKSLRCVINSSSNFFFN